MLATRQYLPFTFLFVGLMSGCAEEEKAPSEPQTMFPGPPDVTMTLAPVAGVEDPECAAACCGIPEDGKVVVRLEVTNWLLAPHEECGEEPQCGPVVVTPSWSSDWGFEIETVESEFVIDVKEIAAEWQGDSEWQWNWTIVAEAIPRPEFEVFGLDVIAFEVRDEVAQRRIDGVLCSDQEDDFHAYTDIAPTTAPGTYVMRAVVDDAEVSCTFEVTTGEDGNALIETPFEDDCAPEGVVDIREELVEGTDDAPAGIRRLVLDPWEPVARISLELSRDGEILLTGSHEPTGELTFPEGEECTIVPCQIATPWGLAL